MKKKRFLDSPVTLEQIRTIGVLILIGIQTTLLLHFLGVF